jgi:hypothetical protein
VYQTEKFLADNGDKIDAGAEAAGVSQEIGQALYAAQADDAGQVREGEELVPPPHRGT